MSVGPGRRRGQDGSALVELTWLSLFLMIPLVYLVITVVTVQRAAFGATEASRSAGRAFVLAPDLAAARQRAYAAAALAMDDQGMTLDPAALQITCRPTPASCLRPGSVVEVRVDLDVPLPLVPSVSGQRAASIAVHASHAEPYGTYREARR